MQMSSTINQLNKAYYLRSKISNYPICQDIVPVPDGLSVVVFKGEGDIDEYCQIRGIDDPENFEVLPVGSFFDFMREVADMGFIGIWYLKNYPVLFGNYTSDIDIELPNFAYTFNNEFIGASGEIDPPISFVPWRNYSKTDKILQRFARYTEGVPFDPSGELFTIVHRHIGSDENYLIRYARFLNASPLQGPYVSDLGAYCLFSDEEYAHRYYEMYGIEESSSYAIEAVDDIQAFLDSVRPDCPVVDIGINPGNERYLQGYFLRETPRLTIKTVLGVYELQEDCQFVSVENVGDLPANDTIGKPNTLDPSLREVQTTVKNPLKNVLRSTGSSVPRREAEKLSQRLVEESLYAGEETLVGEAEEIAADSFLVFGFDKIMGNHFSNNQELVSPCVFQDIVDAIFYFYHVHFVFESQLRLEGFYYCQSNTMHKGSQDEDKEQIVLSEHRVALQDLVEMILSEGYGVEHSELLKSFINRSSISLEIEACGYLGDLAVYNQEYLDEYGAQNDGSEIAGKVIQKAKSHRDRLASRIDLDEKYQNSIRIYLGKSYENLSIESLCILETALKQFEHSRQRINYDFAGISMKLCKVFERELILLIFGKWKDSLLSIRKKEDLKSFMEQAKEDRDETTRRLIGWLLKREKIELGSVRYIVKRLVDQCDNEILVHLREHISTLKNGDSILSDDFLEMCRTISTRYRNGGVHEKIVTYEICKEAFENILMKEDNYLKMLLGV
jgi:hypothetical protein